MFIFNKCDLLLKDKENLPAMKTVMTFENAFRASLLTRKKYVTLNAVFRIQNHFKFYKLVEKEWKFF